MLTAKEIIREALPIQCVEAVFLALFLTAGMSEVGSGVFCVAQKRKLLKEIFEKPNKGSLLIF